MPGPIEWDNSAFPQYHPSFAACKEHIKESSQKNYMKTDLMNSFSSRNLMQLATASSVC